MAKRARSRDNCSKCSPKVTYARPCRTGIFATTSKVVEPHAFEMARDAALLGLAPKLGGPWLAHMLEDTELGVWWCRALDRLLSQPLGDSVRASLAAVACTKAPERWGDDQIRSPIKISVSSAVCRLVQALRPLARIHCRARSPQSAKAASLHSGIDVSVCVWRRCIASSLTSPKRLRGPLAIPGGVDGSRFDGATYVRPMARRAPLRSVSPHRTARPR